MPMIAHKDLTAFSKSHSYEEFLDWVGSYFINFIRSKDVLLQFNTEKECSELVYDFDGDGVFDDAPMLGDTDGNGKPYEPSDIYWTMLHIADKAITSMFPILKLTQTTMATLIPATCSTLCMNALFVEQD